MKKIIILLCLSISSLGCQSAKNYMTEVISKTYIGMPESEFKDLTNDEQVVYMDEIQTIYKIRRTKGKGTAHKFFYFQNNKLRRIDEGERATDLRIKID